MASTFPPPACFLYRDALQSLLVDAIALSGSRLNKLFDVGNDLRPRDFAVRGRGSRGWGREVKAKRKKVPVRPLPNKLPSFQQALSAPRPQVSANVSRQARASRQ